MSAEEKLVKVTRILRAILDADERGQGLPFAEAMTAARALFPHRHEATDGNIDKCRACGHDIRNEIHAQFTGGDKQP